MPKIVDKDAKRLDLIKAATEVFARDGFANTRMADVAVAAGVGKGTIYEYFPSKDELFWAVCENLVTWPEVDNSFVDDPERGFAAIIEAVVKSYEESNAFYLVLLDYWAAILREKHNQHDVFIKRAEKIYDAPRSRILAVVKAGQQKGVFDKSVDADAIVALAIAGIEGLRSQKLQDPQHLDFPKCVRMLTDMLLRTLTSPKG